MTGSVIVHRDFEPTELHPPGFVMAVDPAGSYPVGLPHGIVPGQFWFDKTAKAIKERNAANDNWDTFLIAGAGLDLSAPGPIGGTTPNSGAFTTLDANDVANLTATITATSGEVYGLLQEITYTPSGATTAVVSAMKPSVQSTGSQSMASAYLIGFRPSVEHANTTALLAMRAMSFDMILADTGGAVNLAYGNLIAVYNYHASNPITNVFGTYFLNPANPGGGGYSSVYAHYVPDLTAGSSINYAWHSGQGLHRTKDPFLISNATNVPGSGAADAVYLYAQDVTASSELRVMDEASNVTTLSPHNFEMFEDELDPNDPLPFGYRSENLILGKRISVYWTKLIRYLEAQSGEQFMWIEDLPPETMVDWDTNQTAIQNRRQAEIAEWQGQKAKLDAWEPTSAEEAREKLKAELILGDTPPEPYTKKTPPKWIADRLNK